MAQSVQSLAERDTALANQVIASDERVNSVQRDIEDKCLVPHCDPPANGFGPSCHILHRRHANDLERMSDYAKGIAKISLRMGESPLLKPLVDIPRMLEKTDIS